MPARDSMPEKSGVSAHSSDMLQPPQPPDCSHSTLNAVLGRASTLISSPDRIAAFLAQPGARQAQLRTRASCSTGAATAPP
jgi:hypothetical protein